MLGIILLILKIILWIVLGILGLILLLLLMILFVPIRYSGMFSKCETMRGKGKVSYLLNVFRVLVEFRDGQLKYKVKVLFFTVFKEGYDEDVIEESEPEEAVEKDEPVKEESQVKEEVQVKKEVQDKKEVQVKKELVKEVESKVEKSIKEVSKVEQAKTDEAPKNKDKKSSDKKTKNKKQKKKKKQIDEEESTIDKAKRFYGFLKQPENRGVFKFVLRMIGKVLKSILPRKIEGRLNFGTDDPATTGYVLAIVSSMYPIYQENFVITPDFEGPRIEGNVKGRGRIIIGVIVYYAVRTILDKRIRRLIKEVRK